MDERKTWYAMKYSAYYWCVTEGSVGDGVIYHGTERACKQIVADHNAEHDHSEAIQAYNYEHDRAEALHKALVALVEVGPPTSTNDEMGQYDWACCGLEMDDSEDNTHAKDCPWLLAKQLLAPNTPK